MREMIKDCLSNAELYYNISENLKRGFEWLHSINLKTIESGKYFIDGDKIYANVQEYQTKLDAKYEAHKKYIDIQYMIKGTELIGVCSKDDCETCVEYDESADIEFLNCNHSDDWQNINEDEFLVLFPNDAHKPSICIDEPKIVKKVVVKVPCE